jgi:DNA topoisomerase I
VLAAIALAEEEQRAEEDSRPQRLGEAIRHAGRLGNWPATCRKHYIHPAVIERFQEGTLCQAMNSSPRRERPVPWTTLSAEEYAVLDLLRS